MRIVLVNNIKKSSFKTLLRCINFQVSVTMVDIAKF